MLAAQLLETVTGLSRERTHLAAVLAPVGFERLEAALHVQVIPLLQSRYRVMPPRPRPLASRFEALRKRPAGFSLLFYEAYRGESRQGLLLFRVGGSILHSPASFRDPFGAGKNRVLWDLHPLSKRAAVLSGSTLPRGLRAQSWIG